MEVDRRGKEGRGIGMASNKGQFKKGLLYGVGIDDTSYPKERRANRGNVSKVVWYCPVYSRWRNMLKRCYTNSDSAYSGVTVCDSWLVFSNYKRWYDAQVKLEVPFDVDKDLLQGLSRVYSPETCLILPKRINNFLAVASKGLPGTYFEATRNKFQAYCQSLNGARKHLGRHESEMEAHRAWQLYKTTQIEDMIEEFKGLPNLDQRVIPQLEKIKDKLKKDVELNKPTLNLKLEGRCQLKLD